MARMVKLATSMNLPIGPWTTEPDALEFRSHGLRCLVLRTRMGHLCGYVQVLRRHRLYAKAGTSAVEGLDVHGGVTFSRVLRHRRYMKRGFWIGFDCAHLGDLTPYTASKDLGWLYSDQGMYRDVEYVTKQVQGLAKQLAEKVHG